MIYSGYTFQGCYSAISALQAYFLPTHGNREASVLGKLPWRSDISSFLTMRCSKDLRRTHILVLIPGPQVLHHPQELPQYGKATKLIHVNIVHSIQNSFQYILHSYSRYTKCKLQFSVTNTKCQSNNICQLL
jgi:hypothetical protein